MKDVSIPKDKNCNPTARIQEYEYDNAGKPIKWRYPSGKAVEDEGRLALSGLGLQNTGSEKDTYGKSIITILKNSPLRSIWELKEILCDDLPNLFDRFLNPFATVDWYPARSWTIALLTQAKKAVENNSSSIEQSIKDIDFAYQRVAGVNPGLLKRVVDPEDVELLNKLCKNRKPNTYYVSDYQALRKLRDNNPQNLDKNNKARKRFVYYPKAFFE